MNYIFFLKIIENSYILCENWISDGLQVVNEGKHKNKIITAVEKLYLNENKHERINDFFINLCNDE